MLGFFRVGGFALVLVLVGTGLVALFLGKRRGHSAERSAFERDMTRMRAMGRTVRTEDGTIVSGLQPYLLMWAIIGLLALRATGAMDAMSTSELAFTLAGMGLGGLAVLFAYDRLLYAWLLYYITKTGKGRITTPYQRFKWKAEYRGWLAGWAHQRTDGCLWHTSGYVFMRGIIEKYRTPEEIAEETRLVAEHESQAYEVYFEGRDVTDDDVVEACLDYAGREDKPPVGKSWECVDAFDKGEGRWLVRLQYPHLGAYNVGEITVNTEAKTMRMTALLYGVPDQTETYTRPETCGLKELGSIHPSIFEDDAA